MTPRSMLERAAFHVVVPAALVALGYAASFNQYLLYLATIASITYILTAGFNIVFGYAGMFNLAYVTLFGLSAFLSIFLEVQFGLSFWTSLVVTIAAATLISVIVAAPTMRLEGIFLAILTLGFALAVAEVTLKWQSFTGGAVGIYIIPRPVFFGVSLINGTLPYFVLCGVGVVVAYELSLRTDRSALGSRYRALRSNPRVLSSVGASIPKLRLIAFATSGALAGLAGTLFAHFQPAISLESFGLDRLIALLLAISLGGAGSLLGPFLGVVAIVLMDELALATGHAHAIIYGVCIMGLCALGDGGIAGAIERYRASRQRRPSPVRDTVAAGTAGSGAVDLPQEAAARSEDARHSLSARNVSVRFGGIKAVTGVTVSVRSGEVLGLIGPNGAGKTTLLNAMTGNVLPAEGKVYFDDTEISGRTAAEIVRLGIARTFQSPQLVPELSVIDNVKLGFELDRQTSVMGEVLDGPKAKQDDAAAGAKALGILAQFEISGRAGETTSSQPYAVLRLVEIARNLMLDPHILLLDEPGAGLSQEEQAELARILRRLAARGIGIVIVDHNLGLIRASCDRLVVLDYGTTIAEGAPDDVFKSANVVAAYLGAAA